MANGSFSYEEAFSPPPAGNATAPELGGSFSYEDAFEPPSVKPSGGIISDLGKSLKAGVQRLPGMAAGLADLPIAAVTGARPFTKAADALGEATGFQPGKWADETKFSAGYEKGKQAVDEAWKDGSAGDIALAYLKNPGYTANQVAESLPGMVAGGLAGRALMGAGQVAGVAAKAGGVGPAAPGLLARTVGEKLAAPVAAGIGEGAVTAGQQMAQYQGEDQQKNALASLGAGLGTTVLGTGMGRAANKLGLETAETAIINAGRKGAARAADEVPLSAQRRILGGMVSEAVLQELPQSAQEQMWQNYADGKPLMEGVARAATEGAIAGGVMGAGANVSDGGAGARRAQARQNEEAAAASSDGLGKHEAIDAKPLMLGNQPPDQLYVFPDGTVGRTGEVESYLANLPEEQRADARARLMGQSYTEVNDPQAQQARRWWENYGDGAQPAQSPDYLAEVQQAVRSGTTFSTQQTVDTVRNAMEDAWLAQNVGAEAAAPGAPAQAADAMGAQLQTEFDQAGGDAAVAAVDARVRTGRILSGLQNLLDAGADNTVQVLGGLNEGLSRINEQPLDQEETGRVRRIVDAYMGFRGVGEPAALPADRSAPAVDPFADNGAMESQIPERPTVAPSVRLGLNPAAGPLSRGAAMAVDAGYAAGAPMQEVTHAQSPQAAATGMAAAAAHPTTGPGPLEAAGPVFSPSTGVNLAPQADQAQQAGAQPSQATGAPRAPAAGPAAAQELNHGTAQTANDGNQGIQAQAPQTQAQAATELVAGRPENWRTSMLRAGPVAKGLGIDPKGKRLVQLVAEIDAADAARAGQQQAGGADLSAGQINREWSAFAPETGTLGVPRAQMPQIRAAHRGALVNFLKARGIDSKATEVPANDLKPTQAEFSPAKVEQARLHQGGDRSILVSSDGYVVDGHHQWLAKRANGQPVNVIRLNAPVREVLAQVAEFPSTQTSNGATSPQQSQLQSKEPASAAINSEEGTANAEPTPAPDLRPGAERAPSAGPAAADGRGQPTGRASDAQPDGGRPGRRGPAAGASGAAVPEAVSAGGGSGKSAAGVGQRPGREVSREIGRHREGLSEFRANQVRAELARRNPGVAYTVEEDAGLKNGYAVVGRERAAAEMQMSREMPAELAQALQALRPPRAAATVDSVRSAVRALVSGGALLPNRLGRVVVATSDEIRAQWEPLIGPVAMGSEAEGKAQGFYDPQTKTVFLIADHIQAGDELGVVAHELMHKHGQAVLGEDGWNRLHGAIEAWANAAEGSMELRVYNEAAARVKESRPAGAEAQGYSSQELFPYAVQVALELGVRPNALAPQGTMSHWLGQVKAMLRQVWQKIAGGKADFNSLDLVNLAFGIAQRENPAHAGELDGAVAPLREAWTFLQARAAVKEFQGQPLENAATGMVAKVGRNQLDKMLSDSAAKKSASTTAHAQAVANLDSLFARAIHGWAKADRVSNSNYSAIHRFFTPMEYQDQTLLVKLTVKETVQPGQNNPLYSVEAVDLNEKTPATMWLDAAARADGVDPTSNRPAGAIQSVLAQLDNAKSAHSQGLLQRGVGPRDSQQADPRETLAQPRGVTPGHSIEDGGIVPEAGNGMEFSRAAASPAGADYTAAQQRAAERVFGIQTKETLVDRAKAMRHNLGTKLRQGLVDQFAPIKEVSEKAYILARLSKGSDGAVEAALLYGKPFLRDGVADVDVKDGGFAKVLASLKGEDTRFFQWVAAQRAERLKAEGKENLLTDQDITALKSLNAGKFGDGSPRMPAYAAALRELNAFNEASLKVALDSGLIDQAAYDLMKDQPYVPFYRLMEEEGGMRGPRVSSGLVNQQAWKKLKGGTQQLNADLLQNTLMNWSHLYAAAARNRASLETMAAADKMGIAYKVPADTKGSVKVMRDGVAEHWAVEDPYLLDAISAMSYAPGGVVKAMAPFKRLLTFGVTVNPTFKIRNLIRDTLSAMAQGDLSYNPLENLAKGWKASGKNTQTYASMLASGGIIKFGTQENTDRVRAQIERLGGEMLDKSGFDKLKGQMKSLWEVYEEFGDRTENLNRAALYERLIAKGHGHAEAAFMARDLMDFSMSGKWETVRFLTQTVPFLNARLQGLYKLGRAAKEDPRRFAAMAGAVSLASLGLLAAYSDDEDWKKREDWDRDNFWWFKVGDKAFRIPKPFEVGAIGTVAERTAELMLSDEMTGKRFGQRISDMVFNTFAMDPTPQFIKPFIDVYANKDSFSGRPIEGMADERLRPQDRYNERTSEIARMLGSWGLPDPVRLAKGEYSGLSPKQIDFLLRGYFGWLATVSTTAGDTMVRPMLDRGERPAMRLRDTFLAGNFVETLPTGSSRYVTAMYEQAKDVEQAWASYQAAQKSGDIELARSIQEEEGLKLRNRMAVANAKQQIAELGQQAKKIEGNRLMSADAKRERLDELEARKHQVAQRLAGLTATR
jgi:hypothetical protein